MSEMKLNMRFKLLNSIIAVYRSGTPFACECVNRPFSPLEYATQHFLQGTSVYKTISVHGVSFTYFPLFPCPCPSFKARAHSYLRMAVSVGHAS